MRRVTLGLVAFPCYESPDAAGGSELDFISITHGASTDRNTLNNIQ